MLEIIKEAGSILKDLPDLAIWILIGIIFYKVVIIGSIFGIAKLAINRLHDYFVKPKVIERPIIFNDLKLVNEEAESALRNFLHLIIDHRGGRFKYSFI